MNSKIIRPFILMTALLITAKSWSQNPENWTSKELIEPATLSKSIQNGKEIPIIISVGPGALIPNSIDIGMVKDKENFEQLKKQLANQPRDKAIVIYCGCCPFEHCPNVRPAIALLKEMAFTNYKLLNLPHNIKTDWIDKGFPVASK